MRICLVSKEYPPETGWGGIGTFTYNIAHGLSDLGHEVHVISSSGNGIERTYQDRMVYIHRVGVKSMLGQWRIENIIPISVVLHSYQVAKKLNQLIMQHKIEIVEFPEWGAEGFCFSFNKKIPMIIKLHTPLFLASRLNEEKFTFKMKCIMLLEKISVLNASCLSSPSKDLAKIIEKSYRLKDNIVTCIHNPIDSYFFNIDKNKKREEGYVLYVGRLEGRKGVQVLSEAIPKIQMRFPNTKFVFIGKERSYHGKPMKAVIMSRVSNKNSITFIDHMDRSKLSEFYMKATVAVVPSIWENFPNTCLEPMACGVPVIASNVGGISEIISDKVDGLLVSPNDPDALAESIICILENPAFREKIGKMARQKCIDKFSKERISKKTIELYTSVIRKENE